MATEVPHVENHVETPYQVRKRTQSHVQGTDVDVRGLEQTLRRSVEGEVRFDRGSKAMYAVDASNYRQVPIAVVVPKSKQDVISTVAACREFGAPVLSRGGGTSLAGQCCNVAVVIDWSKYLNQVLELNLHQRWGLVQPGTVCDTLRKKAMKESNNMLTWGPDPATHNRCCFGGMIGNNSCGAHAQMSGKCDNNIEEMEVLLYDGTVMSVGWMDDTSLEQAIRKGGREGDVYRKLRQLRDRYADLVRRRYTPIPRRVSGYNLDQLIPGEDGRFNVARALVGSEGTLVTFLEAKCRLIDARAQRCILMLGYPDVYEAADHVPEIDRYNPTALEGIDYRLYENIEKKGGPHRKYLKLLPEGKGWLMVELGADRKEDAIETAHRLMDELEGKGNITGMKLYTEKEDMDHIWEVRESGLGATAFVPGEPDTWPGWEDSAVAPEHVGAYLRELREIYNKYNYTPALYGHFGHGCIHCRVDFDVRSAEGIRKMRSFLEEATDLCVKYKGSLSGEHGDGQARAEFLHKMFGPELIEAFREYKTIWDPDWKMNPGKVVDPFPFDTNLRLGADYHPWEPQTHFKYPEDGGSFAHAALRCVGVGKCRRESGKKSEDDTMCPSYMVTHEERHTTRGRAHHLWEMLHGGIIDDGWRSDAVKESLDLCLSCKGCKGDCPVNVDMATYKAEFLSHYWEGRLRPRYAYAFGMIDKWARIASVAPGFFNLFTQLPVLSNLSKLAMGAEQKRIIPAFAAESFKQWWRTRPPRNVGAPQVVLWADTFNNYFFPETSQAAVDVLEHAGFQVIVPQGHLCCGRPLYDYGFLGMARNYLERDLAALAPHIDAGTPMVVLEPSCCSVFRDELNGLMPDRRDAHRLMENTFTFSEFLQQKADGVELPKLKRKALVQGHCHHKAIMRLDDEKCVMEKIGLDYKIMDSGCCGMAGAFGYEPDKYDVSIACGERVLLPEVRKAGLSTVLMADGFSCKEQIAQATNRNALHLAEVLQMALHEGPFGPPGVYPERRIIEQREQAQNKSMQRAGMITVGVLAAAAGLWLWRKLR